MEAQSDRMGEGATGVTCDHATIGADPSIVRFYECCHSYYRGDRRLTSVTSVLKSTWPEKPDFSAAPDGVIESARERGTEVDALFSAWLAGTLDAIPAGTREDSKDLLLKLIPWWQETDYREARAQIVLADDEIAGTADIVTESAVFDLKTTYNLEPTYRLQVGGYCHLYEAEYGELPETCGIIHLTKRFPEPKCIVYDPVTVVSEFRVVLTMWRLTQRLTRKASA